MKQLFTTAAVMLAMTTANAADFAVYQNGEVNPNLNYWGWYNIAYNAADVNPTDTEGAKVLSFKPEAATSNAASGGLQIDGKKDVYTGPLNTATLHFSWYAEGTGEYWVRLTGGTNGQEYTYKFNVGEADLNKWNTTELVVSEVAPFIAEGWKNFFDKGAGYVFGFGVDNAAANAKMYFNNVYYSNLDESWERPVLPEIIPPTTVPVPSQNADEVLSMLSGKYPAASTFGLPYWGQATVATNITIDGAPVLKLENFNYQGWDGFNINVADYKYMHVDFYPCEATNFGFTPISLNPTAEKGWQASTVNVNEWNSYDVELSYFDNVDLSAVQQIKFDNGTKVEAYIANVYFWGKNNGETPVDPIDPVEPNGQTFKGSVNGVINQEMVAGDPKEYPYTFNYSVIYNEDRTLTIAGYFDFSDGEPVGFSAGGYIYINNAENKLDADRKFTTTQTYNSGESIEMRFKVEYALGSVEIPFTYVVGSVSDGPATGVAAVEAAEAEVEYYNLQGVRVANPENGIFIRRQGNKVSKVIR